MINSNNDSSNVKQDSNNDSNNSKNSCLCDLETAEEVLLIANELTARFKKELNT